MNHALARSTTSDFGTDSMFEKSRYDPPHSRSKFPDANERIGSRTSRPDEDAPPVASVNDMMNDIPPDSSQSRFQPRVGLTTGFGFCGRTDTSIEHVRFPPSSFTRTTQISACRSTTLCPTTPNSETSRTRLTAVICHRIWLPSRQVHRHTRVFQVSRRRE